MECCNMNTFDYDLAIIGGGSASFSAAIKATELGKSVVIIEMAELGGTCVNFGCVPSKTLIRAAEVRHKAEFSNFKGVSSTLLKVNFHKLIDEKRELVASLQKTKYQGILDQQKNIKILNGRAQFINKNQIDVDGKNITAEKIIIATGSRPSIPIINGLDQVPYLTSKDAFELNDLPEDLAIIGGGYIALEIAQMFARLGTKVTIIQRSEILSHEDTDISAYMSSYLKSERIEILNQSTIQKVGMSAEGVYVNIQKDGKIIKKVFSKILIATGRQANTENLNLESTGVKVNPNGTIQVNHFGQTNISNIYAAGDVVSTPALVYVAAYEGNLAAENALKGNIRISNYDIVPWVIFTDPQICGVGLNETQAEANEIKYDVSILTLDNVPRSITARDTRGFIKLLRKKGSDQLIGARIIAPEGSELLMELSLIIRYQLPLSKIADEFHPYLTLSEGIKLAIQAFDKDIKLLSCCAT